MATRENHEDAPGGFEPGLTGQVSRRDFLKLVGLTGFTISVSGGLAAWLAGCGGTTTETGTPTTGAGTTTATAPVTTAATVATTAGPTATTAATGAAKSLKLGYLGWLTGIQGTQFFNSVKANDAMVNGKGGIKIGADQYTIEFLAYDTNNDQNTAVAGANKLIFEDKVQFMAADSFVEAFMTDSEANKVIVSAKSLIPPQLTPDYKYLFNTGFSNAESAVGMRWFVEKFPDKKTIMLILPDMELGHIISEINAGVCKVYGMTVQQEFYMLGNPDMSSLGTKVKQANPDVVCLFEMSPLRAIREAGWTGQFFSVATNSIEAILATASAADIEGFIGTAYPTEFDPPLTQTAKDFKDAYTTLFGKWDNPTPSDTAIYSAITAALEQAQSTDPDKVAEVLGGGMKWESPCGPLMMVPRPDVGNTKTVDSVNTVYMKQVVGGKATLLDTVDLDKAAAYFADYLAKAPPAGPPAS
jgi:ABC-type branched-subunit amino acid transport system substrate-binding protein